MSENQNQAEFGRFGKSFQLLVRNGHDLETVLNLDEALWGAISAPTTSLAKDEALKKCLDEDNNGRITSKEIRKAIGWMLKQLPNHGEILPNFDGKLKLGAINAEDAEGKAILESAKYILKELAAEDKENITLPQVRQFLSNVTAFPLNGDGVLTTKAATEAKTMLPQVTDMVNDVVLATGGAKDADGSQGLDDATMATFLAEVPKYLEWYEKGQIPAGKDKTDVMTVGLDTPALSALVQANAAKIDRFFQLCELLNFDKRISGHELSHASKVEAFDPATPENVDDYQQALPISSPNKEGILPLQEEKINPSFHAWLKDFTSKVVQTVLGTVPEGMTKADWQKIKATFAPYESWLASKTSASVEKVPVERLRSYLSCEPLLAEVKDLMRRDKLVADIAAGARQVERLILYRENLLRIANNFVNFSELYDINNAALFECGKMVIDGRWFELIFQVDSPAAHSVLGAASQMFLIYAEINMAPAAPMNVVIPVTSGSKGNLFVGKRGVFYDNNGLDHDAKIVKIQENPVCLSEALLAPFSRLWKLVEGRITAWSGDAESKLQSNFTTAITVDPNKPAPAPAPAPAKPEAGKEGKFNSTAFMGIGVVIAALGSSLAFISKTLSGMTGFQIWMTVLVAILALMLPISLIAILKLNRQDLSAILEGCGWGINLRLRLTNKVRRNFTHYGKYPAGAKGTPRNYVLTWILSIILLALLIWGGVKLYKHCKAAKQCEAPAAQEVVTPEAPAAPATPAAPAAPAAPAN